MNRVLKSGVMAAMLVVGVAFQAASADRSLLKEFENAFVELSEDVRPSVVEISAEGGVVEGGEGGPGDLFRFFGQPTPEGDDDTPRRAPSSTGSGFVFDRLGHIVTNNHVVKDSESLTVILADGEEREATIVGQDPDADLAVIKIDPSGLGLKPVRLGTSAGLKVGQYAIAMGSPSGLTGSFSYGHVTGLGRESLTLPGDLRFQSFIQTDAAINLGNSGGPLCNIDGEVIGVNVAIVFRANSIGFAIPVDRVKDVVPQLIAKGKVIRGWLGVSIQDVEVVANFEEVELSDFISAFDLPDEKGAVIQALTPDGPAEQAGLQADDVIREINGRPIAGSTDLINTVSAFKPGKVAKLGIWRRGQAENVSITIGEFPGMTAARYGKDILGMYVSELKINPEYMKQQGMEEQPSDFYVVDVKDGSAADEAGIKQGHVIVEVAQKEVRTLEEFRRVVSDKARPGKTLLMRVLDLAPRRGASPEDSEDSDKKIYLKVPEDYSAE